MTDVEGEDADELDAERADSAENKDVEEIDGGSVRGIGVFWFEEEGDEDDEEDDAESLGSFSFLSRARSLPDRTNASNRQHKATHSIRDVVGMSEENE